jgi:Mn-dependent DtxR family transcriptional regulator
MLDNIGSVAGTIWHYLEKNSKVKVTPTKLARELSESQNIVMMAVGWLAREGKLDFEKHKNRIYITLKTQQSDAAAA